MPTKSRNTQQAVGFRCKAAESTGVVMCPPPVRFFLFPTFQFSYLAQATKPITPMSNLIHFDNGQQSTTYELATFRQRIMKMISPAI